jgi:hypothetical protein
MENFTSILSTVGHAFKVFFTDATKVAAIAEPIIDIAFPGFASLYNAGVSEVLAAENAAIAAGTQNGSGTQKLAYVLGSPSFLSAIQQFETTTGVSFKPAQQTSFVNAIVSALNSIPSGTANPVSTNSPTTPVPTPSTTPSTSVPSSTSTISV